MKFAQSISIHPYFKAKEGQLDAFVAKLPEFCELTSKEAGCHFYNFTINGDVIFCREAYQNAEAVVEHLGNVGEALGKALELVDILRVEVHGPAEELEKLKEPMADLKPEWFVLDAAVDR